MINYGVLWIFKILIYFIVIYVLLSWSGRFGTILVVPTVHTHKVLQSDLKKNLELFESSYTTVQCTACYFSPKQIQFFFQQSPDSANSQERKITCCFFQIRLHTSSILHHNVLFTENLMHFRRYIISKVI